MATSFEDVYDLNLTITNDKRLQSLTTNLYYYLLYQYLTFAIGEFTTRCWNSLTNTPFSQDIYQFTGDGSTISYLLSPTPSGDSFYISIDNTELESTDYSYNSSTKYLTFSSTPINNSEIYISNYTIGSFTQTLSTEEKTILSIGMTVPFVKTNLLKSKQLEQMISASPVNIGSQANHNKVLNITLVEAKDEFLRKMNDYAWRNDPNELADLMGSDSS